MDTGSISLPLTSTKDGKWTSERSDKRMVVFGTAFDTTLFIERTTDEVLMSSDWPTVKWNESASIVAETTASTDAAAVFN